MRIAVKPSSSSCSPPAPALSIRGARMRGLAVGRVPGAQGRGPAVGLPGRVRTPAAAQDLPEQKPAFGGLLVRVQYRADLDLGIREERPPREKGREAQAQRTIRGIGRD